MFSFRSNPVVLLKYSLACCAIAGLASALLADNNPGAKAPAENNAASGGSTKDKSKPHPVQLSPEREAAVLTFVRLHHAELEALLIHLRDVRPKEYDKAMRELFRATERLGQIQDRDQELYELELRLWKSQSRLQLLLARLQMGENDDLKKQVRDAVQEQFEVKLAMLERQEKRLSEQARRAEEELNKMKSDRDKWVDRQVNMLTRQSNGASGSDNGKSAAVNAADPKNATGKNGTGKSSGKTPDRQDDNQPRK